MQIDVSISAYNTDPLAQTKTGKAAPNQKHPAQGDTVSFSPEAMAKAGGTGMGEDPFGLSPEQAERVGALFGELDSIFSPGKELTAKQEERVGEIFNELDSLLPVEEEFNLTAEEEKRVDAIFEQLDSLYANETLTDDQQKKANTLEKELDSIFDGAQGRESSPENLSVMATNPLSGDSKGLDSLKETAEASASQGKSPQELAIDRLKEQIKKLKQEIAELEKSDLPEKEKNNQIQEKQAQLTQLNDQLAKAQKEQLKASGMAVGGGTRANGFGNSVSSF